MEDSTGYKFQQLRIYQLGLDYVDLLYSFTERLPQSENFNLRSQLERAATSIVLNIAEGSTGQTDSEQARFLGMALRSLMETVVCLDLIQRRNYVSGEDLTAIRDLGHLLFVKMQAMRRTMGKKNTQFPVSGPRSGEAMSDIAICVENLSNRLLWCGDERCIEVIYA